jgi:hypothetical protein
VVYAAETKDKGTQQMTGFEALFRIAGLSGKERTRHECAS